MTNHFAVLGLAPGAKQEEVAAAFEKLLADRRGRKTGDLHAALAVLSDSTLRRAHEIALFGESAGDKLSKTRDVAIDFAKDAIPDIDVREVLAQMREVGLKMTVIGSGAVAKAADLTSTVSRAIQVAASKRLRKES
ncbi:MAG: hypothetical protein FD171_675 [Actinobacteria bacterium]|nr:MAG: hypothetical protein FD171_675 [Actinomycetota bacterium]